MNWLKQAEEKKWDDLDTGEDLRGDVAVFVEGKHIIEDGWTLDIELGSKGEPVFFRVIENGVETRAHGWVEGTEITQWG